MRIDANLLFVPVGSPLSLVGSAGAAIPSTNVIDLLGLGSGVAPTGDIIGNATLFGTDLGIGDVRPQIEAVIGTTCTTSTSATLNVAFQAAPDVANTHVPTTWTTLAETGPIAVSLLNAGRTIARLDYPAAWPANLTPRFIRLLFQVPAATDFTAGTIAWAGFTFVRDDYSGRNAQANYLVA